MKNNKNILLRSILDISGSRYKMAQDAMKLIQDLASNLDKSKLEKLKVKPALYAIDNVLKVSNNEDT